MPAEDTAAELQRGGKRATPLGHLKTYRTAIFKLHNPSQKKRAMLRDCMRRAHLAYSSLLGEFMPAPDEVKRLSTLPKRGRQEHLMPLVAAIVKRAQNVPQLALAARDGNRVDIIAAIKSHIGLQDEQDEVGLPTVGRLNDTRVEYEATLDELAVTADLQREGELRDELLRLARPGEYRPLNFPRHSVKAGFALFRHPETSRLYAWLNLHGRDDRRAENYRTPELVNLKTGEVRAFSSRTGALFPLELGYDFHDQGFVEAGEPMTARLFHRRERGGEPCDEFELHVTFKFIVPKLEPRTWLGIDRGVYNLAAYAVIDGAGRLLDQGRISGMELRFLQRKIERETAEAQKRGKRTTFRQRRAYAEEAVHVAVNTIVELAEKHLAQVVIEDLRSFAAARVKGRPKGQRRSGFSRLFNRTQYERLRRVLTYKLHLAGLPDPIRVRPARTSQTCPECGHWSPDNRIKKPGADKFDMDKFECQSCSHQGDADENAARVIALKAIWLRGLPKRVDRQGRLPEELRFESFLADKGRERLKLGA